MKKILVVMVIVFMAVTSQAQTINKVQTDTTEMCQRIKRLNDRQKKVQKKLDEQENEYKAQFRYFNFDGQEIYQDEVENFNGYIVVTTFQDGKCKAVKVYNNCKEKYKKDK